MRSQPAEKRQELVRQIFDEFCDRDYSGAIDSIWQLGIACGLRMPLGVLDVGVDGNFGIHQEPNLQLNLIFAISHYRTGDFTGGDIPFAKAAMMGGLIRRTVLNFLSLASQRSELKDILGGCESTLERIKATYYAGEGQLTGRNWNAALELFLNCIELDELCPERHFAEARVQWLQKAQLL